MVDLLICYSIDFWIFLFLLQHYKLPKSFCVILIIISLLSFNLVFVCVATVESNHSKVVSFYTCI